MADLSILRFEPEKRFNKVIAQQGRVITDADLNEAALIDGYFDEIERLDVIGATGTPAHAAGFGIVRADGTTAPTNRPWTDLFLTNGRYYVEGKLVESFPAMPNFPDLATEPNADGKYWAVLEVFERYVSPSEDPDIVEEALQGPDTAGRSRVEWKLQLVPSTGNPTHCDDALTDPNLAPRVNIPNLAPVVPNVTANSDPCETPNSGGFQGLENQLYRVEVHLGTNDPGGPTLKWSRDNAHLISRVKTVDAANHLIEVSRPGRDPKTGYQVATFVEALQPGDLHDALPGAIVPVKTVTGESEIEIDAADWTGDFQTRATDGFIRAWHGYVTGVAPATNIPLEKGLSVALDAGELRAGDYWLIPARAISGNVVWPEAAGSKIPKPPFGTLRSHVVLSLMERQGGTWTRLTDCRHIFYPLTELYRLVYVGGDGQEAMPNDPITEPLSVGVVNGLVPVAGAKIRWQLLTGAGTATLNPPPQDLLTDANGLSQMRVTMATTEHVVVRADLLDAADTEIQCPIFFNLNLSKANMVSYEPLAGCATLAGRTTVQEAIDRLASIRRMFLAGGDGQIAHRDPADASAYLNLPQPLAVRVTALCGPIPNVQVEFTSENPGELFDPADGLFKSTVLATTDAQGLAFCTWRPVPGIAGSQRVHARFASDGYAPTEELTFAFQKIHARDVEITPDPGCAILQEATNVQEAIDALCANGGGECCEITVGVGGDHPTLLEALKFVLKHKAGSFSICLLPHPVVHVIDQLVASHHYPGLHLDIRGSGPLTTLQMKGGFDVLGMGSFMLSRMRIMVMDEESLITVKHTENFDVQHCQIERIPFRQRVPLLRSASNRNVRLEDSIFDAGNASWNGFINLLDNVSEVISGLWASRIPTETLAQTVKRLQPITAWEGAEDQRVIEGIKGAIDSSLVMGSPYESDVSEWTNLIQQTMHLRTGASLNQIARTLKEMVRNFYDLQLRTSGSGVVLDHLGDQWLDSCEFMCLVSFSGDPVPQNSKLWENMPVSIVGVIKDKINIAGNQRMTSISRCTFDRVALGEAFIEWLNQNHASNENYFWSQHLVIEGNLFRMNYSVFIGHVVTMTNNNFSSMGECCWVVSKSLMPVANFNQDGQIRVLADNPMTPYQAINIAALFQS